MVFGCEKGVEDGAVFVDSDLVSNGFMINALAVPATFVSARCKSDAGNQTINVKIGASVMFSIPCVNSINYAAADGTAGFIGAAHMASTAFASNAELSMIDAASGSTKDIKLFIVATY